MASGNAFSFDEPNGGSSGPKEATGSVGGNSGFAATDKGTGGGIAPETAIGSPVSKRRGRKPLPRDENGNIIRDGSEAQTARTTNGAEKGGKVLVKFNPNNRDNVRQQIQGMHAAVATLTKQPVFLLADVEALSLTNSLCDVLDYHKINLTEAGGAGALYLALGLTVFGIYKPRLDFIRSGGMQVINQPTAPASATEAKSRPTRTMDFTGDIASESVMQ